MIARLKQLKSDKQLLERWNDKGSRINCALLNQQDCKMIKGGEHYEQFINFKKRVARKLNTSSQKERFKFYEWIIRDWGGIKTFGTGKTNIKKVFREVENWMDIGSFPNDLDRISSVSKIAAYRYPSRYVIYDSRVVAAYNWLLLTTAHDIKKVIFFPVPGGRSKDFSEIDITTIINSLLRQKGNFKTDSHYFSEDKAYEAFCIAMKNLSRKLYPDKKGAPYLAEMLLYRYAKFTMFDEVRRQVKVSILE